MVDTTRTRTESTNPSDNDVELSDSETGSPVDQSHIGRNSDDPIHQNDDDNEDDGDDEDSILQRLSGNYRRFSEAQKARARLDDVDSDVVEDTNNNVQIQSRNLHASLSFSVDEDNEMEENNVYLEEENDEQDHVEEEGQEGTNNSNSNRETTMSNIYHLLNNELDENNGQLNDDFFNNMSHSTALRLLANVLNSNIRDSSGRLNDLEQLLTAARNNTDTPNNTNNTNNTNNIRNADSSTNSNNSNNSRNSNNSNNSNSTTSQNRPSSNDRRRNINNLYLSSFVEQFAPSAPSSRIASLINGLDTHDNAYMIMGTLNEISSNLLMMSSIQAERQVPTYRLTEALVRVIHEYPEDMELQLVACRCIYNLAEVNYHLIFETVSAGIIECLNEKLSDLSYIDLAEQALQALELISRKAGRQCLLKGSVPIALAYLDFFTIHAQRKALQIAANSSLTTIPKSRFDDISTVFPTIKNVATNYTDSQCVESSWIFISNVIKSFQGSPLQLLTLIDIDFLEKIFQRLPICLGDGKKFSGLVTFKTCISLLDSLTLLSNCSPKFSNNVLAKCEVGTMIIRIFSSYDDSEKNESTGNSTPAGVSINALLKCPKGLLVSLLKLTHSLLPLNISSIKINSHLDIGNYISLNDAKVNEEKISLSQLESAKFNEFYTQIFPLLLNIYDATVEYKIRRLVFIVILRMVYLMSSSQLKSIIHNSKITSILASTITHGTHIFDHKTNKYKESEIIKFYSLLFGALLVTRSLINCDPKIFLNDFTNEGLISQTNDLSSLFDNEYKRIVDIENGSTDRNHSSTTDIFMEDEDENEDEDDSDSESDYDNENDGDDEEEEEEEEEEQQQNEEEGNEDESYVNSDAFQVRLLNSLDSYIQPVKKVTLMDDGLRRLSKRSILDSLSALSILIKNDYDTLSVKNQIKKSKNLKFLEKITLYLKKDSSTLNEDEWVDLWKEFFSLLNTESSKIISSFELLSSGIIDQLLLLLKTKYDSPACKSFQFIFCSSLSPCFNENAPPLVLLVKKLEEVVDRNESFEIIGLDSDTNQTSRSRAASMTKQMKIQLLPLNDDNAEPQKGILLVVHAIATFETVQNFIKNSKSLNLIKNFNLNSSSLDNDYHYDFYSNGEKIPSDATIFGALYKLYEDDQSPISAIKYNLLRKAHVIKYKAVPGKLISDDRLSRREISNNTLSSLGSRNVVSVLVLLKSLYLTNLQVPNPSTSDIAFLNYKLAAKLNRQLDEPLLVASGILPDWAIIIPKEFPFLFPMETRLFFLKSTSFGYSRLIDYWSSRSKEEDNNSPSSNRIPMLGRSIRHKLRISRDKLFSSAIKVMETYATNPGLIEIEFFDEVGSGLGPTLEFYSNVSKEFSKVKLCMWRSGDYSKLKKDVEVYVNDKHGLFPRPLNAADVHLKNTLLCFKVLGKFLARSFLDSRLVDFHFNPLFFELAIKYASNNFYSWSLDKSIDKIKELDESLASSLKHLSLYLEQFATTPKEHWDNIEVSGAKVSDLMLTFVLPGYEEIKLLPSGDEIDVTAINLETYINKIIDFTIGGGINGQIRSFVDGFTEIFPFSSLMLFSPKELTRLSGNEVENWTVETLLSVIHADHGYTSKSPQMEWLIDIMSSFDKNQRRKFLQFITGSPRLPFDGFKGLSPPFTVVLKHSEGNLQPDDYLPSVMTCANYLKLPPYSSREVMSLKIIQAMNEGNNAFLLS